MSKFLTFYLNNKKIILKQFEPNLTLLQYLRRPDIGLNGTKESCGNGVCGACTVMIAYYNKEKNTVQFSAVKSCKYPIIYCHGKAVYTIEGF